MLGEGIHGLRNECAAHTGRDVQRRERLVRVRFVWHASLVARHEQSRSRTALRTHIFQVKELRRSCFYRAVVLVEYG